jgi:hypothetical protein
MLGSETLKSLPTVMIPKVLLSSKLRKKGEARLVAYCGWRGRGLLDCAEMKEACGKRPAEVQDWARTRS